MNDLNCGTNLIAEAEFLGPLLRSDPDPMSDY
jgi:hypothetical protein